MKGPFSIEDLEKSLKEDNSHTSRENWAHYIIRNNISLTELAILLNREHVVAMRFMWLTGHICDLDPGFVYPYIHYFFSRLNTVKITGYKRSLAKLFHLSGIPKEIEGEAIHAMFQWLQDAGEDVSTKAYSLEALEKFSEQYPDIRNELRIILEDQLGKNTVTFDKRVRKMLEKYS